MSIEPIRQVLATERQAAQLLGVSARTLQDWRLSGKGPLPFTKLGRKMVRYKVADLEAYAASLTYYQSTTQVDAARARQGA